MYAALRDAASDLVQKRGISVYPCRWRDKVPAVPWTEYKKRTPTAKEIKFWFEAPRNIAAITGSVSDNLVVLDFDGGTSIIALRDWCRARSLRTWTVKTTRGWHVHFRVKNLPETACFVSDDIEVICNGSALVPPSVHPNGWHYATVPMFGDKIQWIDSLDGIGLMAPPNGGADPKKGEQVGIEGKELLGVDKATPFSFLRVCSGRQPATPTGDANKIHYDPRVRDAALRRGVIAAIKQRVSMPNLLSKFTHLLPASRAGMFYAACPMHKDSFPSLMCNKDRCFCNSPHCGLHHWADVIDAYATITASDLWRTLTVLGEYSGVL